MARNGVQEFARGITNAMRELLQTKHLYQSVTVLSPPPAPKGGLLSADDADKMRAVSAAAGIWRPIGPLLATVPHIEAPGTGFEVPHVEMYCETCSRRQPFNPHLLTEPPAGSDKYISHRTKNGFLQQFAWAFTCQGCKGPPEVVLIRREGMKLTLCGRSPIEHVDVPKEIPRLVAQHYSGALLAHQCGQTLSGLFMLRVCVEQWVRNGRPAEELTEDSMKVYQESLPADFKQRFPSFPKLYTEISAALHSANGDATLFESASGKIVEHFDARRIFKLA